MRPKSSSEKPASTPLLTIASLVTLVFACTTESTETPGAEDTSIDGGTDDTSDTNDATDGGTDPISSDTESDSNNLCEDGLPRTPFDPTAKAGAYDAPAPDFTVNTTAGEWTLSEHWTGCDNYVFVMYHPGYGESADSFWSSEVILLVDDGAPNTHYFFLTLEKNLSLEQRQERVMEVGAMINDHLKYQDKETKDHWSERFHYITDPGLDIPLVQSLLGISQGELHFTIDRKQIAREGHSVSYYMGGWTYQLANTRYWSKYFNAQYLLDQQLALEVETEDVLVHRVADREDIKGSEPFLWTLPDAGTIAEYERLEIDMRVACPGVGHPYAGTCGEWDTVGSIWLCGDEECTGENRRRIVKWITPYSAPGRWLIDITPELVALAEGGEQRFMVQHGDNNVGPYTYKYTVDFRFSKSADGLRPVAVESLIPRSNYAFAKMADAFEPFSIIPPDDTTKVELYARISGHGSAEGSGCAEFCTFEHTFDVNGTAHQHIYLMENENRCAEWVEQGVTPNQGGTWHFDRSSWCPGWTIEEWREDITASITAGMTNTIEHIPTYGGGPPPGGNMDARVELVYYQ